MPLLSSKDVNDSSDKSSENKSNLKKRKDLVKAVGERMKQKRETEEESSNRLLDQINPFKAGQNLRRTLATALRTDDDVRKSVYYIDEKLNVDINYIPEVLVVGATGSIGQMVVQQLLLQNCRVRVLVRDLYTETLNKFGTSVTYSQGELNNTDSLEYATTDIDKIVYCVDEQDTADECVTGMKNIVQAYQDVRHADYGTQQAAKRSLFRFQDRPEDFYLFETIQETAQWLRNQKYEHGVFTGNGPADVMSSRLRSREDPDAGIDFGPAFAGFICRACADGQRYQAFCRTPNYEYVCDFTTASKAQRNPNSSKNKFTTVRLPFENFLAVDAPQAPVFDGRNVQYIGFRYAGEDDFYLALSYVKVYRSQPEPEFVYLSDARVPSVVTASMVQHDVRQLAVVAENTEILLDEAPAPEEASVSYYQYIAEETLKRSGLSYAIVRVGSLTEEAGDASAVTLSPDQQQGGNQGVSKTSVAQVCARAVMDPKALNKSFYLSGRSRSDQSDDWSEKFGALPADPTL